MDTQLTGLLVFLVLSFHLPWIAARSAFLGVRKARLLAMREDAGVDIHPVDVFLDSTTHLRARLVSIQSFSRVLLLGLSTALFFPLAESNPLVWLGLGLVISGFGIALIEIAVEAYVIQTPEIWAVRLVGFTQAGLKLLVPVWAIHLVFLRWTEDASEPEPLELEDELITLLDASEEDGRLQEDEREMIRSVFQLRETIAREIMVPRIDMLALNSDTDILTATDQMLESGFSRVPVYEAFIDRIVGVLYVKDLLRLCRLGQHSGPISQVLRKPFFVPESKKVDDLLADMQRERIHIAMVVDEYGGVAGLVTLEDIVEELVGEIQDEYDKTEDQLYQEIEEGVFVFQGNVALEDFNDIMETHFSDEEVDTLAGLVYSLLGHIPKDGEQLQVDGIHLVVDQVLGRRIRKVLVRRVPQNSEPTKETPDALE